VQADTIIPDILNPNAFDRFAYVQNNPLNYIDPSGHQSEEPPDDSESDWNFFEWTREQRIKELHNLAGDTPTIYVIGNWVFVIMPEGSNPDFERSLILESIGLGLALTGEAYDAGEIVEMIISAGITGGFGLTDITAAADIGVTQLSSWFSGQSPFGEYLDPNLPRIVGTNQDVFVQVGDFIIGSGAKAIGLMVGGPPGLVTGIGIDMLSTSFSLIYDHKRNYGNLKNHLIVGGSIDKDTFGMAFIIIYP